MATNKIYDIILCHRCCGDGMDGLVKYVDQWQKDHGRKPIINLVGIFNVKPNGYDVKYNVDTDTLSQVSYIIEISTGKVMTIPNRI